MRNHHTKANGLRLMTLALCALLLVAAPLYAYAATTHYVTSYAELVTAATACGNDDTIILRNSITRQATDTQTAVINASGVTVASEGSAAYTINGGGVEGRLLTVNNGTGPDNAFTLDHVNMTGGSTTASGVNGAGVALYVAGDATITHCTFTDNHTQGTYAEGGAVFIGGEGTIEHATFTDNYTAGENAYGGLCIYGEGTVVDTIFTGNKTTGKEAAGGGAIIVGDAIIVDSTFHNNHTEGERAEGGGIYLTGNATVDNSVFTINHTEGARADGGAACINGNATIENSTFTDNESEQSTGGAVGTSGNSRYTLTIEDSTFIGNQAATGAGAVDAGNRDVITKGTNTFQINTPAGNQGDGIEAASVTQYVDTGTNPVTPPTPPGPPTTPAKTTKPTRTAMRDTFTPSLSQSASHVEGYGTAAADAPLHKTMDGEALLHIGQGTTLAVTGTNMGENGAWARVAHNDVLYYIPKDFELLIGVSTGKGQVWNEGNLTIIQTDGDLTADILRSERENVTLTAENGSILGYGRADLDAVPHVYGWDITLAATGDIGAASQPLVMEQAQNRPTLVAKVTDPLHTPASPAEPPYAFEYNLVYRALTDASGNPLLDADGRQVYGFGIDVTLDFNWIRPDYIAEATRLDATAGGSIYAAELTGDLGVGNIYAAREIHLTAPGDILDTRGTNADPGALALPNLKTDGGDIYLTSAGGDIGKSDKYLDSETSLDYSDTASNGVIRATSQGDISVRDRWDLTLIADSAQGQTNATTANNAHVSNVSGNFLLGPILAVNTATVVAQGAPVMGDRLGHVAQVIGKNVSITALDGDILGGDGLARAPLPFEVYTEGGWLSAYAEKPGAIIYIHDMSADGFAINEVIGGGDITLRGEGPITAENDDTMGQPLLDAIAEATRKRAEAGDAQTAHALHSDYLTNGRPEENYGYPAALAAVTAAQSALDAARQALTDMQDALTLLLQNPAAKQAAIDKLTKQITDQTTLIGSLAQALTNAQNQQAAIEAAMRLEHDLLVDLLAAWTLAETIAQKSEALRDQLLAQFGAHGVNVTGAGDLLIRTTGDIGTADRPITVAIDGSVTLDTGATRGTQAGIISIGDLSLGTVTAGSSTLTSTGGIQAADPAGTGRTIIGGSTNLIALGGDVGSLQNPLRVSVDTVSGMGTDGFYIDNDKNLAIGQIVAGDTRLTVTGNVTNGGSGTSILSDNLVISATGDIGTASDPLRTSVETIRADAKNLYLDNRSPVLVIVDIKAPKGTVTINTSGKIISGDLSGGAKSAGGKGATPVITSKTLNLTAVGDIGEALNYLIVRVSGKINAASHKGFVYMHLSKSVSGGGSGDASDRLNLDDTDYGYRLLCDERTGITVAGIFHTTATLVVSGFHAHDGCPACAALAEAARGASFIRGYNLSLTGGAHTLFMGTLTVTLPVGRAYEGQTVIVMYCDSGRLVTLRLTVRNGVVTYATNTLGPVVILSTGTAGGTGTAGAITATGYLNWRLTDQLPTDDATLTAMEAAHRVAQTRQAPERTHLLNADTGTTLTMDVYDDDLYSRLVVSPLLPSDAQLVDLMAQLPGGAALLAAVDIHIEQGPEAAGPDGITLEAPALLGIRLYGVGEMDVSVWWMGADGEWVPTDATLDAEGWASLAVDGLGVFAVTTRS